MVLAQTNTVVTESTNTRTSPKTGINLNSLTKPTWKNSFFLDSVQALNPHILRYPGGTTSQYWDWRNGKVWPISNWQNGIFKNHQNLALLPAVPHKLEDYKIAIDSLDAEPLFVLNVLSDTMESQLNFLHHADNIGLEIKWIELGNEMYFSKTDFVNRFPTPSDYANEMLVWIDSIQADFPNAKIAVIGVSENPFTPNGDSSPSRVKDWNDAVFSIIPTNIDITFHRYYSHGNGGNTVDINKTFASAVIGYQEEESFTVDSLSLGRKAWWTEYNLTDNLNGNHRVATSWLHGLFTSLLHLKKLENPNNEMLLIHQITGKEPFGALDSYFSSVDTLNNYITPLGKAISLLNKAEQNTTKATKLDFSTNPTITSNGNAFSSLWGWRFQSIDRDNIIILNTSSQQFDLNLKAFSYQTYNFRQITSTHLTTLDPKSNNIQITNGTSPNNLLIEPYSLTMVDLNNIVLNTKEIWNAEHSMVIFTNPAQTELTIQFENLFSGFLKLFSLEGKLITSKRIENKKNEFIPINDVANGIYFLNIFSLEGKAIAKKILIEK